MISDHVYAGNGCKWLEKAGMNRKLWIFWKCLIMAPRDGMAENCWIWLVKFVMARYGWKLIEKAQHFLNGWKWLKITKNGLVCLEMVEWLE